MALIDTFLHQRLMTHYSNATFTFLREKRPSVMYLLSLHKECRVASFLTSALQWRNKRAAAPNLISDFHFFVSFYCAVEQNEHFQFAWRE